jgi:hypothetical protein
VIWIKTDAGRHEIQARAVVKERARRNLLLLIDGMKSEEMLLANLAGIAGEDFRALEALGLIAAVGGARGASAPSGSTTVGGSTAAGPSSRPPPAAPAPHPVASAPAQLGTPLDYSAFTAALTQLISTHLGLRGFVLTLAVEKAATIEDLQAVAQRALEQIRDRRGEAVAVAARQTLYGA